MRSLVEWFGFAVIVAGIALFSVPAAVISAGVLTVVAANFTSRRREVEQ